jgi:single-strand DNA-binding protein
MYLEAMATRGLNKVMLIGNLGKDAETRFTPGGASVTNFTLATPRRSKDPQSGEWKEETDWHNVVLWRADNLANYLQKGKRVYVEGRLQTRNWEDQNGNKRYTTEVIADAGGVILLDGRGGGRGEESDDFAPPPARRSASAGAGGGRPAPMDDDHGITDDDVPF